MKKMLGKSLCVFAAACLLSVPSVWAENIKVGAFGRYRPGFVSRWSRGPHSGDVSQRLGGKSRR